MAQADADAASSQDIIVTAQRRAQMLEDVPMSITALSADTVEKAGVTNIHDLGNVAAGVQVNWAGAATQPSIRGVSSLTNTVGFENNVAIYVDGFYQPDMITINSDFANIASIEVLKGPQGTLYGRNATGGAILINTLSPSEVFTGKFEASYGRFDDRILSGYLSGPISDKIRFSMAGYWRKNDNYIKLAQPVITGPTAPVHHKIEQRSIRAKLEADLADNLTATLGYNYGLSDDPRGSYFTPIAHIAPTVAPPPLRATKYFEKSYNYAIDARARTDEGTLKLKWDTEIGTVTSYSGYSKRSTHQDFDIDGTYADVTYSQNRYRADTYQQTVDYAIDAVEHLTLIVGGSYYNDHTRTQDPLHQTSYNAGLIPSFTLKSSLKTEAFAVYVDGTVQITDALSLNAGARYSDEKKTVQISGSGALSIPETTRSATFGKVTPRASIRYEIAPRTNVYAAYSQGFRSGTFNPVATTPAGFQPIKPEIVDAFEIGIKTAQDWFRFDGSAFYYDNKNFHVGVVLPFCPNGPTQPCTVATVVSNAPKAEIYGLDAQISINPVDRLNIRLAGAYIHARYRDFPNAIGTGINTVTDTTIPNQIQDWSNKQMARAPTFSGNVGFDYTAPLGGGELLLTANLSYTDSYVIQNPSLYGPTAPAELAGKQRLRQDSYALLSGQIGWTDPSDHFTVALYGRNLTDVKYRLTYNSSTRGDYSTPAAPLEYGVKVGYKF